MSYKAAIFDLDGTLLDTLRDLGESTNRVLESMGFPQHPLSAYNTFVGNGLEKLVTRSLPKDQRSEENIQLAMDSFTQDYGNNWAVHTCMYEGIEEMLNLLEKTGLPLCILSNKPDKFTQLCVQTLLPNWNFKIIYGVRENVPKKPSPEAVYEIAEILDLDVTNILFIGDSSVDMMTAKNAGMDSVGVLWGFREEKELRDNGANFIISHPKELPPIIGGRKII
jgi:phosphoglycolate phosphatase